MLMLSHLVVSASATPWTVAGQAPLSVGFSRQEHWSGLPFPPPGDLPDPGIEPASPAFPALEKAMVPHSSVLAWRIPGTGSLVGCDLWGHRVGHD